MKTYLELLGRAKSTIDNGFSQVGRALSPQDAAQRALMLLASRAVAVSNALMLLSTHNHANEALPLLRSLLQFAVEMRWISQADSAGRARKFLEEHKDPQWESLWNTPRLLERMNALSFQTTLVEAAANSCRDHIHANSQGLPWGHVSRPRRLPASTVAGAACGGHDHGACDQGS